MAPTSASEHDEDRNEVISDTPENSRATSDTSGHDSSNTDLSNITAVAPHLFSANMPQLPAAPTPSPVDQHSLVDGFINVALDYNSLNERLRAMPQAITTPPASMFGDRNKGKRTVYDPRKPLFRQLYKPPTAASMQRERWKMKSKKLIDTSTEGASPTKTYSHLSSMSSANGQAPQHTATYEHSVWAEFAEEDVSNALARLARLARDEHQKDPTRPVSDYYSVRLAKLLAKAEIEFNASFL